MKRIFLSYTHKDYGPDAVRRYGNLVADFNVPLSELDIRQLEREIEKRQELPSQSATILYFKVMQL